MQNVFSWKSRPPGHRVGWALLCGGLALLGGALALPSTTTPATRPTVAAEPADEPGAPAATTEPPLPATPATGDLPVIDYGPAPEGFPADPTPLSTAPLTEGLHPTNLVGAYDAPGGRPRAFLPPVIAGAELTTPIVERRAGWVAVLLPSANRRLAWVPPGSWTTVPLRDQLIVERATHRLTWRRDGAQVRSWKVALGLRNTPTPLGRTFILGRSGLPGPVYADTDVFALGAVPDRPSAVPPGLRGAHIGLHTWHHDDDLGRDVTDGCIRLTRSGQRQLLAELAPGTELVVVDRVRQETPRAG